MDYQGGNYPILLEEKWKYFQECNDLLNNFGLITAAIHSSDVNIILDASRKITTLLMVLSQFRSPQQRLQISSYLFRLFDLLINSNAIHRIISMIDLATTNQHITIYSI